MNRDLRKYVKDTKHAHFDRRVFYVVCDRHWVDLGHLRLWRGSHCLPLSAWRNRPNWVNFPFPLWVGLDRKTCKPRLTQTSSPSTIGHCVSVPRPLKTRACWL